MGRVAGNRARPEVEQAVEAHQHLMNNSRRTPVMPAMFKKAAEENRWFIFSVSPWEQARTMQPPPDFRLPAKPEGADYAGPWIIDGVVTEPYPINESENKLLQEDGEKIADAVLGIGPFMNPSNSLLPLGVFKTQNNPPTKAEIDAANKRLDQYCLHLINEADEAYSKGPDEASKVIEPNVHFVAARRLGRTALESGWLKNAHVPAARSECPNCGTPYKVGIAQCPSCRMVLDKAKYDEFKKQGLVAAA